MREREGERVADEGGGDAVTLVRRIDGEPLEVPVVAGEARDRVADEAVDEAAREAGGGGGVPIGGTCAARALEAASGRPTMR